MSAVPSIQSRIVKQARTGSVLLFGTLTLVALPVSGSEPGKASPAERESHARMLAASADLIRRTPDENPYLGDREARRLREKLAGNPPLKDRYKLHLKLGEEELRLGNEEASREQLETALSVFPFSDEPPEAAGDGLYLLALAHLRRAETENCCRRATADSCLFPVQGEGIHLEQGGSRDAITYLLRYLTTPGKFTDEHLTAIWLMNLAHMTLGTYPEGVPAAYRLPVTRPDVPEPGDFPRFPSVSAELGVNTFGLAGGVIADDFNGDGWIDLVVSSWDPADSIRYFQNDGTGGFTDESANCHLEGISGGLNLRQADFDNDGKLDLFIVRGAWLGTAGRHPNSLLRNLGPGPGGVPEFVDISYAAGLAGEGLDFPALSAEWADYDLDGDLDLYVANETAGGISAPSQLFRNDGPGTDGITRFTDVAAASGVTNDRLGKGAAWGDFDADGWPDLYVSNLRQANRLYRNRGDGSFEDVAPSLGVSGPVQSFPVWFWDCNNDGILDLFVSNYLNKGSGLAYVPYLAGEDLAPVDLSALYLGDGKGGFRNRVREAGLDVPMPTMGCSFGDLDNDGFPDFYLGTGTPHYADIGPNLLFHNLSGERFEDVTISAGMGHLQKGHSVSFADFGNRGLLDVYAHLGGAIPGDGYFKALFRNPGFEGRNWIQVRLQGAGSNRFGIGSRIRAVFDEPASDGGPPRERSVYVWVGAGSSFGANPVTVSHLGLGRAAVVKRIEILWPGKSEAQVVFNPPVNARLDVGEH